MYSADSLLQPLQILLIRMGQCTVKIGNQHIQIRSRIRLFFHFLIPLPHGQGHFALAHKCANHLIAGIQIFLHAQQNFLKIRSTSAKSGGTKQKKSFCSLRFSTIPSWRHLPYPYRSKSRQTIPATTAHGLGNLQNSRSPLPAALAQWPAPVFLCCRFDC